MGNVCVLLAKCFCLGKRRKAKSDPKPEEKTDTNEACEENDIETILVEEPSNISVPIEPEAPPKPKICPARQQCIEIRRKAKSNCF